MEIFKNSFFIKQIDKLDIREDSFIYQSIKSSFFFNMINKFFSFSQKLFGKITHNSFFIKKIDHIILFLITSLLVSLLFAPTKVIGITAGVCFFALLGKLFFKPGEKLSVNTLDVPLILYIILVGLSVAFSSMLIPSLKGFAKLMVYICCYLVFFNVLKNKPYRSFYLIGIIAVTAFVESLTAIYQNFAGVEALATWQDKTALNPEQIMTRVYGTLQPYNPNLLAGYLTAAISSAAGIFFVFVYRKKFGPGLIAFFAMLTILAAIVFTGSRGAYVGAGAVLAALVLVSGHIIWHDFSEKLWLKKLWFYLLFFGILAVMVFVFTSPAIQHRIVSIFNIWGDSSNSFRMNVYIATVQMFLDNWLTGIGPGNEVFRLSYGLYMRTGFDSLGAYSVPLEIAVESGILAFASFFWFIAAVFIKSTKIIVSNINIEQKILVSCCLAGIVGIIVHGLVDTIFFRPQVQVIFWLLIAVLGANLGFDQKIKNKQ